MTVVGLMLFLGLYGYGFVVYANHDRVELLDLPEVADASEAACRHLVTDLETPSDDRVAHILAGNSAIDQLVRDVQDVGDDALDDDLPARDWLTDWQALASSRALYAEHLAAGAAASFEVPETEDGYPITERMTWAAGPDCERATALASRP